MGGPSLKKVFKSCGCGFSLRTTLLLGRRMIDCLEDVHAHGVVHRDLKPQNFLLGVEEGSQKVYIIDFGLADVYREGGAKAAHVPCVTKAGCLIGTARYVSLNVHRGETPSRRDDLISLGYILLIFVRGRLPWQDVKAPSKRAKNEEIARLKRRISHEELCEGFPSEFIMFLTYCYSLAYADMPDYNYLRSLIDTMLDQQGCSPDDHIEWLAENSKRGRKGAARAAD